MTTRPPRQLVFRGTINAAGLYFGQPLNEAERRRRILAIWRPGTTVYALDDAYFVLWPEPQRIDTIRASGAPVVRTDELWMTGPFVASERPESRPNALLVAVANRVVAIDVGSRPTVDPSLWMELGPLEVLEVEPLGPLPPPPTEALAPISIDLRKAAHIPAADAEKAQAVARILQGHQPGVPPAAGAETPPWRHRLAEAIRKLAAWLRRRPAQTIHSEGRTQQTGVEGSATRAAEEQPVRRPRDPWWRNLLDSASNWLMRTGVGWALGAWHQRYLDNLLDMFESGNLHDALRHAIPLNGDQPSRGTALRPPSPRRNLDFRPAGQGGAASGILGSESSWQRLQRYYRTTAEKLIKAGRFKEAAFVLAELLFQKAEAVAMLEREGEPKLAAELAETANMEPSLRVRLWAKAGDWQRAVRLARRHQVFAEAIAGLKSGDGAIADKLRALWATHRAEVGDFVGAIELVWPRQTPSQAWMNAAINMGGSAAARVLPKQLALTPDAFDAVRKRVDVILQDRTPEGKAARVALAEACFPEADARAMSVFARPLLRKLIEDQPRTAAERMAITKLLRVAKDSVLKADLPPWPTGAGPRDEALTIDTGDQGQVPIFDAARLATGRLLFALGESGVLFTTSDGRPLSHMKVPATRLIPSDTGHRALALIERGTLTQVHRIDLVRWRATTWCEQPLVGYAPTFDGWRWFAALGPSNQLLMLDVTGKRPEIEWNTGATDPLLLRRAQGSLAVVAVRESLVCEVFEVNRLRLKSRHPLSPPDPKAPDEEEAAWHDVSPSGDALVLRRSLDVQAGDKDDTVSAQWKAQRWPTAAQRALDFSLTAQPVAGRLLDTTRVAVAMRDERMVSMRCYDWNAERPWFRLDLIGATRGGIRTTAGSVLFFDDCGRVVVIDKERRVIDHNFRIRL